MATRLRLEEASKQAAVRPPAPGTAVQIAIDLSRTKWVYCVRGEGQEQRRLTTPGDLTHVEALVAQYPGCAVHLAFEACGFGYEIAWWAAAQQIGVTVIAPSRLERAPGRQVKTDRLAVGRIGRTNWSGQRNVLLSDAPRSGPNGSGARTLPRRRRWDGSPGGVNGPNAPENGWAGTGAGAAVRGQCCTAAW